MRDDDAYSNPRVDRRDTLEDLIVRRLSRRSLLKGTLVAGTALSIAPLAGCSQPTAQINEPTEQPMTPASRFDFAEIARGSDDTHHLPEAYDADVLLRWGDAVFSDSPAFDPHQQSAAAQARQFGYNCDYVGFQPLEPGANGAPRGLLCVNHEYTSTALMFPDVIANYPDSMTPALCAVEKAAHGGSVVEIEYADGHWRVKLDSPYNRRIMAADTPMDFRGPAAGNARLAISSDPDGMLATGTLNNCAGGITPWGTYLMAEENFHGYFSGELPEGHRETENHQRYGVPGGWFQWGRHDSDFNVGDEPNAPNRFGWVVEVDILDPASRPVKRTALGRFKHEGAESIVNADGRVVVYTGDDERFEHVYKFVTEGRYDPDNRAANLNLLDHGTLYVARFEEDGSLNWLALQHGEGPLTEANGFTSQADVLIESRRAADLAGGDTDGSS